MISRGVELGIKKNTKTKSVNWDDYSEAEILYYDSWGWWSVMVTDINIFHELAGFEWRLTVEEREEEADLSFTRSNHYLGWLFQK